MKYNDICNKIKAIFLGKTYVMAILNNGSSVAGTDLPESDIDFTIIVKNKEYVNKALNLLKKNIKFLGVEHEVPYFEFKKKLGICVYDKKTMDSFVKILYKSKDDFLQWQKVIQHKVVEAVPIYDPGNILKAYQKRVGMYPRRIQRAVFSDSIGYLKDVYEEWNFANEFNFIFHLPEIIENICLALYSKNRRLFMIPYKRLHKDLKELKPNIEKEMYFMVRGNNSKKNREEKKQVLKHIIDKLI